MSTDDPSSFLFRLIEPAKEPAPTIEAALSHLKFLGAVDVETFREWMTLNPGGVCQLIRALHARLPLNLQPYFTITDSRDCNPLAHEQTR